MEQGAASEKACQIDEVVMSRGKLHGGGNVDPLVDSEKIVHLVVDLARVGGHEILQIVGGHLDVEENLHEYDGAHREAVGGHHEQDADAVGDHHEYVVGDLH